MTTEKAAPPTILVVEAAAAIVQLYVKFLRFERAELVAVETLAAAREFIVARVPTIILLDVNLSDQDSLDFLREIRARRLDTGVVVVATEGVVANAIEALRCGADDFLIKPFPPERLSVTLHHVLERRRLARIAAPMPPVHADGHAGSGATPPKRTIRPLAEVERKVIENAIAACNGNLTEAARRLGINVSTIHRKRQSWLTSARRPIEA